MDDKTFNLLEKLYSEFSEFRKDTNSRFDKLEGDVSGLKSDVRGLKNDVLRIEQDHGKKLEKQDVEIRVIKGGK